MWAGQFANEGFNTLLKRVVKQDRPDGVSDNHNSNTATYSAAHGNGYGFPSSHSQYMGYFAAFLVCHMYFTYQFSSTGSSVLDALWRFIVYSVLYSWAGAVAYSRYVLRLCIFYMNVKRIVALDIIWGITMSIKFSGAWPSARYLVSLSMSLQNSFQPDDHIHFSGGSRPSF